MADALPAAIDLGFALEEAKMLANRGLLLVSLDLTQFFDSIQWDLTNGLATELGLPPHILNTLLSFLSGLR